MGKAKPFDIPKRVVWEAYQRVRANRGAAGDWQFDCRIDKRIDDLAKMFNPIIRGWINYYGRYHKSALSRALMHLDLRLARWAMSKYRRLKGHRRRARHWVQDVRRREPALFAHWRLLYRAPAGQ